jgi:hypothetical protein
LAGSRVRHLHLPLQEMAVALLPVSPLGYCWGSVLPSHLPARATTPGLLTVLVAAPGRDDVIGRALAPGTIGEASIFAVVVDGTAGVRRFCY